MDPLAHPGRPEPHLPVSPEEPPLQTDATLPSSLPRNTGPFGSSTSPDKPAAFHRARSQGEKPATDVYALVTDRITAALEAGTIPWQKPWAMAGGLPRNLASRRLYRGMNVLLLSLRQPYQSPWWLTYKQAQDLGGHVRKGEKSSVVTVWKFPHSDTTPDEEPEEGRAGEGKRPLLHRRAPLLRHYAVFNLEQCEGIQAPPSEEFQPREHERIKACEAIFSGMPRRPWLEYDAQQAYYSPARDRVAMPDLSQFASPESYYATLFHELVHSTGHPTRLARSMLGTPSPFGSPDYSREELVAEFGAAFLCAHGGIFPRVAENSAAYIQGWLAVLKGDQRLLPMAASQAQRAADFILGDLSLAPEEPEPEEPLSLSAVTLPPAETPQQLDLYRVAALIAADPKFRAGWDTFSQCRERNRREGWVYRTGGVEAFLRLDDAALDRAYELAVACRRGELQLPTPDA